LGESRGRGRAFWEERWEWRGGEEEEWYGSKGRGMGGLSAPLRGGCWVGIGMGVDGEEV
jgi:hypothetical protein